MTVQDARNRLNITVDLVPQRNSNRPGTPLQPKQITIHNTDNPDKGADAKAHAAYMKGDDAQKRQVSWHYTVDDHQVVQSLPVNEVGWHAGTHAGNYSTIGIEICENEGIDQEAANERAALLTALSLHELDISLADNVVQHNHWSGKDCPYLLRHPSDNWDAFLDTVAKYYANIKEGIRPDADSLDQENRHLAFTPSSLGSQSPISLPATAVASGNQSLSWNDAQHPERAAWTTQLLASVQSWKTTLDKGNPNGFISGYDSLSLDRQLTFWGELFIAIAKFESGWNPSDVYEEAEGENSIGLLQLSIQDQSNYPLTPRITGEMQLTNTGINLPWGVQIFATLVAQNGLIASGSGSSSRGAARYWSVLRTGHKIDQITALTKQNSGL